MKARLWLLLVIFVALWAAVLIATRAKAAPAARPALAADQLARIERQASALCARRPGDTITLPDGVLVCAGSPRSQITTLWRTAP